MNTWSRYRFGQPSSAHGLFAWLTIFVIFFILVERPASAQIEADIDWNQLEAIVQQNNVNSTEMLLGLLPQSLRAKYMLVYNSRNQAQFASVTAPRFLLYNNDSSLILAMSGAADQAGFNTLEAIQYDKSVGKFLFKSINFAGGVRRADQMGYVINHNPTSCVHCHAGKPIWDTYNHWPGIFGGSEYDSAIEPQYFAQFWDACKTNSIYYRLPGLRGENTKSPHARFHRRLNIVTQDLADLNADRILTKLKNHPRFYNFRAALLAAVVGLEDFHNQPGVNSASFESEFAQYKEKTVDELKAYDEDVINRAAPEAIDRPEFLNDERTVKPAQQLGYVMSKIGLDLHDDSFIFSRGPKALGFAAPDSGTMSVLAGKMTADAANDFPELQGVTPYGALTALPPLLDKIRRMDAIKACGVRLNGHDGN